MQDTFSIKKLTYSAPAKEKLIYLYTNSIARKNRFSFLSSLICPYVYVKYLLIADKALLKILCGYTKTVFLCVHNLHSNSLGVFCTLTTWLRSLYNCHLVYFVYFPLRIHTDIRRIQVYDSNLQCSILPTYISACLVMY